MKIFNVKQTNFIKNRNPFTDKAYNTLFFPKAVMERLSTKVFLNQTYEENNNPKNQILTF